VNILLFLPKSPYHADFPTESRQLPMYAFAFLHAPESSHSVVPVGWKAVERQVERACSRPGYTALIPRTLGKSTQLDTCIAFGLGDTDASDPMACDVACLAV
jgi:hypothetical protein